MGFLAKLTPSRQAAALRASDGRDPFDGLYGSYVPPEWIGGLSASGVPVSPELAMTLSAYYCGVKTIAIDLATSPIQTFKRLADGGRERVRRGPYGVADGSVGQLAYLLQWKPNPSQTAAEYMLSMAAQLLMRERAYAEIVFGPNGEILALVPRHPDRVTPERLPSGDLRYRLAEPDGRPRYLLGGEMHAIRGLSLDGGLTTASAVQYGATAIGSGLAQERAAARFFKSGMTAAMLAAYQGGQKSATDEATLHASISRFATGVENSFGLMLVPDTIKIEKLAVEPEKAQMMQSRKWTIYEVARYLRIHPVKLMDPDSLKAGPDAAAIDADHMSNCLRPPAYLFEQAIQSDLILAKDTYYCEFLLEARLRGDLKSEAEYFGKALEGPWMWPSEIRLKKNMNPDPELDAIAKLRYRPGTPRGASPDQAAAAGAAPSVRETRAILAVYDDAARSVRRERTVVVKLAKKHASDVAAWRAALQDFYADHAAFLSARLRLAPAAAHAYADQRCRALEADGAKVFLDDALYEAFESCAAGELCTMALHPEQNAA